MDPLEMVLDEVALEGLDGITIPSVWIRLENRNPTFPLKLDSYTKDFIWRSLASHPEVNFFELPQERDDVVLFDRFSFIDPHTGIQEVDGFDSADCYPVQIVLENKDGIQGSCLFFKERKDVTRAVRKHNLTPCLTLEEAFQRWGRTLVLVASQRVRFRVLIGDGGDPDVKLSDHSYCMLERVGRARWQGELQRDLHSCSFKTDARKMHYMRKSLKQNSLVSMQSHILRLPSGAQQHSILLLLKRFHVDRRSKYDILMESTSNVLLEYPDRIASMSTLRGRLNVSERTFKRVYQYMQAAKMVQVLSKPVEELNPAAGACTTMRGTKLLARCLKLIKPYVRKTEAEAEADDDDDNDEDAGATSRNCLPSEGRFMEKDLLSQAYDIILSSGTKGISQTALRLRMGIGKLESRMMVRVLERTNMIKGLMEDEGRQRTAKYISHLLVGQSDLLHHLVKEQERSQLLRTEGLPTTPAQTPQKTPATPQAPAREKKADTPRTPAALKTPATEKLPNPEKEMVEEKGDEAMDDCQVEKGKAKGKRNKGTQRRKAKKTGQLSLLKQSKVNFLVTNSTPKSKSTPPANQKPELESSLSPDKEEEGSNFCPDISLDQTNCMIPSENNVEDSVMVIEEIPNQKICLDRRPETYRQLKRKNLIVEAVRNLKIIEGIYTLQRLIHDEEKMEGVNTKCCKKSILRLVRSLSKEGLLKLFRTTVIQDKISKKVEFVVHPSISPCDGVVRSAIEQVRFRISSSYPAARNNEEEEAEKEDGAGRDLTVAGKKNSPVKLSGVVTKDTMGDEELGDFKPSIVPGLSRSLGFQPKMPRLRLTHTFLWYLIYGHPLRQSPALPDLRPSTSVDLVADNPDVQSTYPNSSITVDPTGSAHAVPKPSDHTEIVPDPSDHTEIAPDPSDHTEIVPDPSDHTEIVPDPSDHTEIAPDPSDHTEIAPDPSDHTEIAPDPSDHTEIAPDPSDHTEIAPDPSDHTEIAPDPSDHTEIAPDPSDHTEIAPDPSDRTDPGCLNSQISEATTSTFQNTDNPNPEILDLPHPQDPTSDIPLAKTTEPSSTERSLNADLDVKLSVVDDGPEVTDLAEVRHDPHMIVYVDELSWRRYVPPAPVHKDFGPGWALTSDILLSLPLSIFVQIIQISFKVDGLDKYLSDPVKQHYLIRFLPSRMKRQLLHKRKYIFSFHERMQGLIYMGLMQFAPVEKFQEKDQVYIHLNRNCVIVDTTTCDPHYNLAIETRPFERRPYTLNTLTDVDNYWFDLLCVCLTTPLGVIRKACPRQNGEEPVKRVVDTDRCRFRHLEHLLKGSREIRDEGVTPGDGKGAGGLDSNFFGHLRRNWIWTSHLMKCMKNNQLNENGNTVRLRSLLNKDLVMGIGPKFTGPLTTKRRTSEPKDLMLVEEQVQVTFEPSSRNQQVKGGRKQKRKKTIKPKEVKVPHKKKKVEEVKKRSLAHDEADNKALLMMTRQRVMWTVREDSVLMLCRVASHFLNRKMRRPFVPWCVVRDMLHAEFEESLDKTSLSVGRRSRYILKNPQTRLNFKICLAEVYQDKPLIQHLQGRKHDPNDPKECSTVFCEFVSLLRQKFRSASGSCDVTIPDTKQELFSRFKVYTLDDMSEENVKDNISSIEDVHALVLNNLIQSTLAMSNTQMKCYRSFQTFHTYNKYRQDVLYQVFVECRKKGLINRRRGSQLSGPKKNRALPVLPMSYQLSQSYYRCFSWRLPSELCNEVFDFMKALRENGAGDRHPLTSFLHEGEDGDGARREGKAKERAEEKERQNKEERTETEGRMKSEQEPSEIEKGKEMEKDNMVPILGQVEKEDVSFSVHRAEPTSRGGASSPLLDMEQSEMALAPSSAPCPPLEVQDMLQYPLESPGGSTVACLSLMTLGLLSVHVTIPQHIVVIDSTMLDNNEVVKSISLLAEDDDDEEAEESDSRKRMKSGQASHTSYLMMRGFSVPGIVRLRNLNTSDSIVVESCSMRLQLRHTPAHTLFTPQVSPLDFSKQGPSLLPPLVARSFRARTPSSMGRWEEHLVTQRGYSPADLEAVTELTATLKRHGSFGMDRRELVTTHALLEEAQDGRTRGLQQYIQDLLEEELVLEVGGSAVRLVLMGLAEPWLLTSTEGQEDMLFRGASTLRDRWNNNPLFRKRTMQALGEKEPPRKRVRREKQTEVGWGEKTTGHGKEERGEKTSEEGGEERGEKTSEEGGEERGEKTSEEGGEERGEKTSEEGGEETGGKTSEERGEETGGKTNEEGGEETGGKTSEEGGEETGGKISEEGGEETGGKISEEGGEETGGKTSEEGGEETGGKTSEEGGEETGGKTSEEGGEETGGKTSEEGGEETGGKTSEEGGEETGGKTSEEGGEETGGKTSEEGDQVKNMRPEEKSGIMKQRGMETRQEMEKQRNEPSSSDDQMDPTDPTSVTEQNPEGSTEKPWSWTQEEEEEDGKASGECDLSFVSRPWRIVDGSLNVPVCKGMLEAVMFQIMSCPGLTERILLEQYRGVLQPVVVMELVQALVELGCVKKKYVTRCPKASLFSSPAASPIVWEKTGELGLKTGEAAVAFYEPTIECCLRLGQVFPHVSNWKPWLQFTT
ncbi:general transcription factor 3C polypeptide 1 [Esox lucius]|uniref:general transcription factor 3C polypeptide 1 n=1 Tax=Esox lucius TaxID=8010 RepID=UPI00147776F7|nr:general transcription factor 3C polypeptide 1 [Esox lucius]